MPRPFKLGELNTPPALHQTFDEPFARAERNEVVSRAMERPHRDPPDLAYSASSAQYPRTRRV